VAVAAAAGGRVCDSPPGLTIGVLRCAASSQHQLQQQGLTAPAAPGKRTTTLAEGRGKDQQLQQQVNTQEQQDRGSGNLLLQLTPQIQQELQHHHQ
jgi:hypothetical protein